MKNQKIIEKPSRLGFSLIELSIVILVIGILTIGITQGSRIIREARLKSARALTAASPVHATNNLSLWLDTTAETAFDNNIVDGNTITNWYETNNQNANAVVVTQATANKRPTYLSTGMNGLPTIQFSGSDKYLNVNGAVIDDIKAYSIFIVTQRNIAAAGPIWGNQFGNSGVTFYYTGSTSLQITHAGDQGGGPDYPTVTIPAFTGQKPDVLSLISSNPSGLHCGGDTLRVYTTGVLRSTLGICAYSRNNIHAIGYSQPAGAATYNGNISEIIIFTRALNSTEIQAINQYLGQKWGIDI